jgi:hypothetical protein
MTDKMYSNTFNCPIKNPKTRIKNSMERYEVFLKLKLKLLRNKINGKNNIIEKWLNAAPRKKR